MRTAVIGAGIGGLAAAYDLAKAGRKVTIIEASDQVGGLAGGFKDPRWDWSVEKYYHHWFATDRHMIGLIDELGLSAKVLFPRPYTAVYHEGHFYPLDSPMAVLRFPGLSFADRLRLGAVVAFLRLLPDGRPLEGETADSWMRRWVGPRAYESLWEPMLVGKFGDHYRQVNMAWLWARFKARTPRLGTFEGGFQVFADMFADRLLELGVSLRLNTPVRGIEPLQGGELSLVLPEEQAVFDQCLATVSPKMLSRMAPSLSKLYLDKLLALKSMGAVVLILALKRKLSEGGIYWHNLPKGAGFPFLALVEHTNYLPPAHFGGDHIVYCGDYLDPDHEYFSLSKEELLNRFLPVLPRFNLEFDPSWVRKSWLFRTPYAQPVPERNHSQVIPDIKTPIPNLWYASMSQVYPWDRGTNYAVEIGRRAARDMGAQRDGNG
jgi:protoporphyrinogen oxidase